MQRVSEVPAVGFQELLLRVSENEAACFRRSPQNVWWSSQRVTFLSITCFRVMIEKDTGIWAAKFQKGSPWKVTSALEYQKASQEAIESGYWEYQQKVSRKKWQEVSGKSEGLFLVNSWTGDSNNKAQFPEGKLTFSNHTSQFIVPLGTNTDIQSPQPLSSIPFSLCSNLIKRSTESSNTQIIEHNIHYATANSRQSVCTLEFDLVKKGVAYCHLAVKNGTWKFRKAFILQRNFWWTHIFQFSKIPVKPILS